MARFASFAQFYPFYLAEHSDVRSRRMHFAGSILVVMSIVLAASTGQLAWLWLAPIAGYGCAWVGHFFFQKNRPATFSHPFYSLAGDWVMFWDILRGRVSIR